MKKNYLCFGLGLLVALWSCNDTSKSGSDADSTNTINNTVTEDSTSNNSSVNLNAAPLSKEDSSFVMEAAMGGLMEVQGGQIASENGMNNRVKAFGQMMVDDHGKANQELSSLVSNRGITLPASLPADKQKHLDDMKNMKGKSFDTHYVNMMVSDHEKDIDKFKKEASNGNDPQLKAWAANTLPVLQKHMDSIKAIKKGM